MTVNKPCCIDIYSGDEVSDKPTYLAGLDLVAAAGIPFLIHKASEGTGYADPRYAARRQKWMAGGPVSLVDVDGTPITIKRTWGAYHFFHGASVSSAVQEANFFLRTAALTDADEPFLDWEAVGKSGYQPSPAIADAFCSAIEDAIGRPCWVYSGNVAREQLARAPSAMIERFGKRPLWFCQYGNYRPDLVPRAWKEPTLWQDDGDQYGPGPHTIPGIARYCDNSTVVGSMTVAKLSAAWGKADKGPIVSPASTPLAAPTDAPAPTAGDPAQVSHEEVGPSAPSPEATSILSDIRTLIAKLESVIGV